MTPDAPDNPIRADGPGSRQRGSAVGMYIGAALSLAGVGPAAVLAWTDRLHGWILLPLVILAFAGVAVGYASRHRGT